MIGDNYLYIYLCEIPLYLLAHKNAKSVLFLCKLSENNYILCLLVGKYPAQKQGMSYPIESKRPERFIVTDILLINSDRAFSPSFFLMCEDIFLVLFIIGPPYRPIVLVNVRESASFEMLLS